jgi:hypothetical protein
MAETEHRLNGRLGPLLAGLGLAAATVVWIAAVWFALYRPEALAPFGAEVRLAALALIWALPLLLTLLAWNAWRQARAALHEARALHAETDALARQLRAARAAALPSERQPERAPTAAMAPQPEPAGSRKSKKRAPGARNAPAPQSPVHPDAPEIPWSALDFPRSETDTEGFKALRRAMEGDPKLATVIRTAQHVLSLLAQEGVHLEGHDPAPPVPPEVLRQYASGVRGPAIAVLGATEDRESLALAVGRLRRDPAFRSAAHQFVAAFDTWLASIIPSADDATLARIAVSRSGRAFRLIGRATGTFG